MTKPVPASGLGHLRVVLSDTAYIGPGRADLLEGIAETGSIAAAGKAMGMSYKRAWGLVQALNSGFGAPLVLSSRGGAAQGGASLTPLGQAVLTRYRMMQANTQAALAEDVATLRVLIDDMSKKT
ncbi:MAG: LysR family transcriptional regulator [Devosia sp.]|uniref:winged helix-turn-helix domain-containing protein n=1 Tax=Devosia sp. TaxID=1871048 RepID=UPI0024C8AB9E|nr:LysR family transcriptional regulator [Devosia sp.]UYN98325.1 MAG: LysR family transcriptional regulator [Devosia sp.]